MKTALAILFAALTLSLAAADDSAPAWTCALKVGTPKQESKSEKKTKNGNQNSNNNYRNNRTSTKTISRSMVLPVKVTFGGKDIPTSGITLKSTFFGDRDGEPAVIGESTTDVKLENNTFKADIKSPEATLTKTMRTHGRRTESTSEGDRITGAVVQLLVDGKVVRSWASKPAWARHAKQDALDTEAILKGR